MGCCFGWHLAVWLPGGPVETGMAGLIESLKRQQLPANASALWSAEERDAVCVYRGEG